MDSNSKCTLEDKFNRVTRKNTVGNTNVLTISAQCGLINQFEYYNSQYASEDTSGYTLLHKGDFAYNKSYSEGYPLGATKKLERYESGIVSPLYICFAAKAGVCVDFYSYYFESEQFYREIYKIAQEGARNHGLLNVPTDDFFKMKIADPPLAEQKRIAEILGCCDRVIALKKELIAEKKQQKKALMQKLLNPDSGFRLPGFAGQWEQKTIGNVAPLQRGFDLPNAQLKCGKYPVVYSNGILSFHNEFMVEGPGVVTGRSGTIGAVFYVTKNFWPHNTSLWVTDFLGNIPLFVYYLFQVVDFSKCSSGSGVPTLNRNDIHKLIVNIPIDKGEQQAIADVLSATDKEIDLLEQELVQQQQQKKSLMQLLLTGIVRV